MYLKAVTIQGFKTFSQRSEFVFQPGITAIVGPNGSGKSNFADAIRWVLGEQSLRSLRGRRTEDILFAGGSGRPPAGMAEVTLLFDNAEQALDLPYTEVTITRRAYRSGENEYLLNRERVRLRDVSDLLGRMSLGIDGFALVGQGTVDAALSLRAEDRRELIEHAAAIGHLYTRLDDARSRLVSAQQNLVRVEDLISEISPRLRSLERQVRQAREREALQMELARGLIRWYAHLWAGPSARRHQAVMDRDGARGELERAAVEREGSELALRRAQDCRARIEQEFKAASDRLTRLHAALASLDQATTLDRARISQLRSTREEYQAILAQNQHDAEREQVNLEALAGERSTLVAKLGDAQDALEAAEQRAGDWAARRAAVDRSMQEARRLQTRAEAQRAAASARLQAAQDRLSRSEQVLVDQTDRIASLEAEARRHDQHVAEHRETADAARRTLEDLAVERARVSVDLERAQSEVAQRQGRVADIDRDLHSLRARLEALEQLETSGAGYFAGVRAVLQAANGHGPVHLDGIVGVVAKLIEVSPDKELAIETALGSHLQDIVVQRWADAEAAIAHLKKHGAGRATFLPLDTLRPARRSAPPESPGLLGVASALVHVAPRFQVVSDFLLGQTLVVENLAVARSILPQCAPFWQIVTLEGEITRPTGVVTGGSASQSRGALARHRELRTIRRLVAEREREREQAVASLAASRETAEAISSHIAELDRAKRVAEERHRHASRLLLEATQDSQRAAHALALRRDELKRLLAERATAEHEVVESRSALEKAEHACASAANDLATVERERELLERDLGDSIATLASKRSECNTLRERLATVEAALAQAADRQRRIESHARETRAKLADMDGVIADLEQSLARRLVERRTVADDLAAAEQSEASLRTELDRVKEAERAAEGACRRWELAERETTSRLQDAERRLQLADAELDGLRQQVLLELGPVDDQALGQGELRAMPPEGPPVVAKIETLPEAERLRSRLDSLRSRLRGLPIMRDAVTEYESARSRFDFLSAQAADLRRTITMLHETIDETRSTMSARFDETFATVSAAFARRFVELFGGGCARLVLEGEDDDAAGIEVIAQPPGKRANSLAMLSGGERALTAAALLFALIEANPPPFCVLDEVDAALDESNVGRFCSALQGLSERTQFIVITHNRRTMEAAARIYGLALENRCETRVLAVQLSGT